MEGKIKVTIFFLLGAVTGILIFSQMAFREDSNKQKPAKQMVQQFELPVIPAEMTFAGENVPIERWEVREAFDRELIYAYYNPGHMSYILKLSKRYFPIIEERLKANNLPEDFKYLCVAESNLQNLTSPVGAKGFWQFMSYTAPGYNLEVREDVDERYDVIKSTDAACKYLKQAYAKFGNWTAAAASYNCGMGGYNTQASFQKTKYYYDLQLPVETNKYMFRILTFKLLMSHPQRYGYLVNEKNGYKMADTRTVIVTSSIPNLAQWAINNGTTYKMVRLLNPWIRSKSLAITGGKSYGVRLPKH